MRLKTGIKALQAKMAYAARQLQCQMDKGVAPVQGNAPVGGRMMRISIQALAGLLFLGLIGCSEHSGRTCERHSLCPQGDQVVEVTPPPVLQASYPPSLLFDRVPGRYSATNFNYRSDWPSTNSYYAPGEVIQYNLYSVDYQGPNLDPWHASYRRFETQRSGIGYR
jgi:hypothetical protein